MKKLNISSEYVAYVSECLEKDKVSGKPICIYKEGFPKSNQPKSWPKHFKNNGEAEKYLSQMEFFKNITKKKKK